MKYLLKGKKTELNNSSRKIIFYERKVFSILVLQYFTRNSKAKTNIKKIIAIISRQIHLFTASFQKQLLIKHRKWYQVLIHSVFEKILILKTENTTIVQTQCDRDEHHVIKLLNYATIGNQESTLLRAGLSRAISKLSINFRIKWLLSLVKIEKLSKHEEELQLLDCS